MIGARFIRRHQPWEIDHTKNYDGLKSGPTPKKTKLISIIASSKSNTPGHVKRYEFTTKLKEHYGDKLDVFGFGINQFQDKWNVISPYKYHIVIENSVFADYWTEKLSDTFLCETYPVYYGCPNIHEYFDNNSLSVINIENFEESVKIIDEIINENYYEKSTERILESKNLILDKYQLFPAISSVINNIGRKHETQIIHLYPEKVFKNLLTKSLRKIRQKIWK